ncbi:hypothetical protein Y1Q_0009619 [Alligator mississippiensis]|uniref:Uncharacterized protein n=1 Tax=Alligator mississippiensis TaxID=8496 RepID=A0A151NUZ4_ALLMI|nr:hypothetical protein Y1Q_0009619 [Alligator mississippiensis]
MVIAREQVQGKEGEQSRDSSQAGQTRSLWQDQEQHPDLLTARLRTEIELSPTHSSKASNITTGRESILRAFPTAFPAVLSTGQ